MGVIEEKEGKVIQTKKNKAAENSSPPSPAKFRALTGAKHFFSFIFRNFNANLLS